MGLFDRFKKKNSEPLQEKNDEVSPAPAKMPIPGYLVKPTDPIAQMMFGNDLVWAVDPFCGYKVQFYGPACGKKPYGADVDRFAVSPEDLLPKFYKDEPMDVKSDMPEILENWKTVFEGEGKGWYAISTMKMESVLTSPLKGFAETLMEISHSYGVGSPLALPERFCEVPFSLGKIGMLPVPDDYAALRGFDEVCCMFATMKLGDEAFKDYIMCARKGIVAWKIETVLNLTNNVEKPVITDFTAPAYPFATFTPLF